METNEDYDLLKIGILIDNLQSEIIEERLFSLTKISLISKTIGPDRTRDEFLGYLSDLIYDEDKVLLILSEELITLIPYLGEELITLISPLEYLCSVEEINVRNKSIISLSKIIEKIPAKHLEKYIVPLLERLLNNERYIFKITFCNLASCVYKRVNTDFNQEIRIDIIKNFSLLSRDKVPCVRKAVAINIVKFCSVIEKDLTNEYFLENFKSLISDEQDNIRIFAVQNLPKFIKLLDEDIQKNCVNDLIQICFCDPSFRVRIILGEIFCEMFELYIKNYKKENFVELCKKLMTDQEVEVRCSFVKQIEKINKIIDINEHIKSFEPTISELINDKYDYVRSSIAFGLIKISTSLKSNYVENFLIPKLTILLKDECSDVIKQIIFNFEIINNEKYKYFIEKSILLSYYSIAADKRWRVRLELINNTSNFIKKIIFIFNEEKKNDSLKKQICELCVMWIVDEVHMIRKKSSEILNDLIKILGSDWGNNCLFPAIYILIINGNYIQRLSAINAIKNTVESFSFETIKDKIFPMVRRNSKDKIFNIRLASLKCLFIIYNKIENDKIKKETKKVIKSLSNDNDEDIKECAKKFLQII